MIFILDSTISLVEDGTLYSRPINIFRVCSVHFNDRIAVRFSTAFTLEITQGGAANKTYPTH